jgi:hypothetical protein
MAGLGRSKDPKAGVNIEAALIAYMDVSKQLVFGRIGRKF